MARIRTIKPDFWTDEKIVELSAFARLLFIGLWNFADDDGRMQFSPRKIMMQVLPADSLDSSALFGEIRSKSMIDIYVVDGVEYLEIKNFSKHQKIDKRTASKFPANTNNSSIPPDFPRLSPTEGNGMEGKVKSPSALVDPSAQLVVNNTVPVVLKPLKARNADIITAREVFSHWQSVMNHQKAVFNDKVEKLIKMRLAEGFTVDNLLDAIDGCARSPHNMGVNKRKTRYDGLDLILRDGEHTNRFMGYKQSLKPFKASIDGLSVHGNATAQAAQNWLNNSQKEVVINDDEEF